MMDVILMHDTIFFYIFHNFSEFRHRISIETYASKILFLTFLLQADGLFSPLGQALYQTFTNKDFNIYLEDFAIRLSDAECAYKAASPDDMRCGNFRKPNVSSASPQRHDVNPSMTSLWLRKVHQKVQNRKASVNNSATKSCSFVANTSFPYNLTVEAGAPKRVIIEVSPLN